MVAQRHLHRVLQATINVGQDSQQFFGPYPYAQGSRIELSSFGNVKHYAGVFNDAEFQRRRTVAARQNGRFPFIFGTDRTNQRRVFNASRSGYLYVVIRVGVFNPGGGTITVLLDVG